MVAHFKYSILLEYISKSGFHIVDKRDGQYGFQTVNSSTFAEYKQMTKIQVIGKLKRFGALLYLLDDGWMRGSGYNLSVASLCQEEKDCLVLKLNNLFDTSCKEILNNTISFIKKDMKNLLFNFKRFIPNDLDVFQRKIQPLIDKFKV